MSWSVRVVRGHDLDGTPLPPACELVWAEEAEVEGEDAGPPQVVAVVPNAEKVQYERLVGIAHALQALGARGVGMDDISLSTSTLEDPQ